MRVCLVVAIAMTACGFRAAAAQEGDRGYVQLVNEYFLTNAVYPQERGEIQLTTYPRISFEDGHMSALPIAVEFGLTDRWQVELEWVSLAVSRPDGLPGRSGIGDLEFETQYSVMNVGGTSTHVAFGAGLTIPAGPLDAGGSSGEMEFEPTVSIGTDLHAGGRRSQLFGQVALGLAVGEDDAGTPVPPDPEAHELLLGFGYMIAAGHARWTAELSWSTTEWNGGDETELYFAPGLMWDLPDTWELGIATPIGLGGDAVAFGISLVLLYEFELGDDDEAR